MIPSKTFLKERVLHNMLAMRKVSRCKAPDMPQYKKAGWGLNPVKAFKNVDADILSKMDPLPEIPRKDYIKHLNRNNIPHNF